MQVFWSTRKRASAASGTTDIGSRGAVTAGKNLDGFLDLIRAVVVANGLGEDTVYCGTQGTPRLRHTVLPGYYRPSKDWDALVVHGDELVAAVELKSQVGSFGNNFNNRAEEVVGMGEDLRVAFREGLIGDAPRPFTGYLMLLEEAPGSSSAVRVSSGHFEPDAVFEGASYAERYEILCGRLVREGLYDAATVLLSGAEGGAEGRFRDVSPTTSLRAFVARLAARVAEVAARG
ncbi:PaeR7I family type II restriction endonuclease [Rubrivirga sp. S365]|nr:PaeR7I family type II restriction endonuclease [Rubrivirga sp. S365]